MNHLTCLGLLLLAVCSTATKFNDCGSAKGKVSTVDVSGCPDTTNPCPLVRGNKPEITINFESKEDASEVKAVVHGVIAGVPMPFPIPQPDGCKSGLSCPIKNGQSYTYKNAIDVRKSYPPLSVTVRYELKDQSGADIACVEIPSKIQ